MKRGRTYLTPQVWSSDEVPLSFSGETFMTKKLSNGQVTPFSDPLVNSHQRFSMENFPSQARNFLSYIKDPLWERVCCEVSHIMGDFAILEIWQCRVGALSSSNKTLDLYCQTEESGRFVKQYKFIILGVLQKYFYTLTELHIKITSKKD